MSSIVSEWSNNDSLKGIKSKALCDVHEFFCRQAPIRFDNSFDICQMFDCFFTETERSPTLIKNEKKFGRLILHLAKLIAKAGVLIPSLIGLNSACLRIVPHIVESVLMSLMSFRVTDIATSCYYFLATSNYE